MTNLKKIASVFLVSSISNRKKADLIRILKTQNAEALVQELDKYPVLKSYQDRVPPIVSGRVPPKFPPKRKSPQPRRVSSARVSPQPRRLSSTIEIADLESLIQAQTMMTLKRIEDVFERELEKNLLRMVNPINEGTANLSYEDKIDLAIQETKAALRNCEEIVFSEMQLVGAAEGVDGKRVFLFDDDETFYLENGYIQNLSPFLFQVDKDKLKDTTPRQAASVIIDAIRNNVSQEMKMFQRKEVFTPLIRTLREEDLENVKAFVCMETVGRRNDPVLNIYLFTPYEGRIRKINIPVFE
jgi:hypothetical protein